MTRRTNAERWRRGALRLSAAAFLVLCLALLSGGTAHAQRRSGGRAAAPRMERPMGGQRNAARAQSRQSARQQRQFDRQQQRAYDGRGERPSYGQAGTPRPAFRGAGPAGAARPEYRSPYAGAGPGSRNVRPAFPGNARPYAFPPGHLGSWLNQHRNFAGQEQLLRNDPNFNRLPSGEKQRLMQQLRQVNQMPAAERERRLERAEAIEHMSPQDRMQLHQSTRQLAALPPDRQARVKQAFRDLRGVPLDQRQTVIDSERYQNQFSPQERGILTNLLRAEPYEPPR